MRRGLIPSALLLVATLVMASCGSSASEKPGASPSERIAPSPTASMTSLRSGDLVQLMNGLSVVVPESLFGSVISNYPGGPTELFWLMDRQNKQPVSIWSLSVDDLRTGDYPVLDMEVVARSTDGSVEVRWLAGKDSAGRSLSQVAVVTHLQGKLTGMVILLPVSGRSRALTPADAFRQATALWRLLSIGGADLPDAVGV